MKIKKTKGLISRIAISLRNEQNYPLNQFVVSFMNIEVKNLFLNTDKESVRDTGADLRADPDFSINKDIKGQEIISTFHMGAHSY